MQWIPSASLQLPNRCVAIAVGAALNFKALPDIFGSARYTHARDVHRCKISSSLPRKCWHVMAVIEFEPYTSYWDRLLASRKKPCSSRSLLHVKARPLRVQLLLFRMARAETLMLCDWTSNHEQ